MYHTSVLKLVKSEPLARLILAIPAMGTLLGSILMAFGAVVPCLLMDAFGFLCGILIFTGLLLKYLWIEHLLSAGEEIEGEVLEIKDNPGIPISPTSTVAYQFSFAGVEYTNRVTVHLSEEEDLLKATIMFDPDKPDHSIIKELYCVSAC